MAIDEAKRAELTLPITGMTCASCVRRVERALGKVEGVDGASVNLATEKARVVFDPELVGLEALKAAVEKAGYGVRELPPTVAEPDGVGARPRPEGEDTALDPLEVERAAEIDDLRRKFIAGLAVGIFMMAVMYLPLGIEHAILYPLLLVLATPIQIWAGAAFYKSAWADAKHLNTNMNTLVAVGTSAAYGYSAFVTLWPSLADR